MSHVAASEFRLKLYPKDFKAVRGFYEATLGFPVLNEWNRGEADQGVLRDNPWGDTSFCIAHPESFEVTFFTQAQLGPREP